MSTTSLVGLPGRTRQEVPRRDSQTSIGISKYRYFWGIGKYNTDPPSLVFRKNYEFCFQHFGVSSGNLVWEPPVGIFPDGPGRPTKGGSTHVRPATTDKRCYTASLKNPGMVHYDVQHYTSTRDDSSLRIDMVPK